MAVHAEWGSCKANANVISEALKAGRKKVSVLKTVEEKLNGWLATADLKMWELKERCDEVIASTFKYHEDLQPLQENVATAPKKEKATIVIVDMVSKDWDESF